MSCRKMLHPRCCLTPTKQVIAPAHRAVSGQVAQVHAQAAGQVGQGGLSVGGRRWDGKGGWRGGGEGGGGTGGAWLPH